MADTLSPVLPAPSTPPTPARRGPGRPIKHVLPPEGQPIPPELQSLLKIRARMKERYDSNYEAINAAKRRTYHARRAKYLEDMARLAELEKNTVKE